MTADMTTGPRATRRECIGLVVPALPTILLASTSACSTWRCRS